MTIAATSIRLADLLAALSVITDLGIGRQPEAAMRACLLATRLADLMDIPPGERLDVYYASLLRYIGCTAYAHEEALQAGGDEIAARRTTTSMDLGNPRELLSFYLLHVGGQEPPLRRARVLATALPRAIATTGDLVASHCEVGASMARRLELGSGVETALGQIFERWDGKGRPGKLKGEDVCIAVRFAHVATQVAAHVQYYGPESAAPMVRQRSGGFFDPAICDVFLAHERELLGEMTGVDAWETVVEAEPEPRRHIPTVRLDDIAHAFADMADLKLAFTRGHSTGVAELTESAARAMGLPEDDARTARRAALFHDLGRVAVPNGVWERRGPLSSSDWERVRLHPYHTERILARSPALAPLGRIAGLHHERLDGSGYYRQLPAASLPVMARILAAADVYQALNQERPHRPAVTPQAAAATLQTEAQAGRLDTEATRAVLEAAGHRMRRARGSWPAGLSDREVEVLRLIARGASYKDVARELVISSRTAAHHVQHIYGKIGVSTRAAAAMFAMEHDLLH